MAGLLIMGFVGAGFGWLLATGLVAAGLAALALALMELLIAFAGDFLLGDLATEVPLASIRTGSLQSRNQSSSTIR